MQTNLIYKPYVIYCCNCILMYSVIETCFQVEKLLKDLKKLNKANKCSVPFFRRFIC